MHICIFVKIQEMLEKWWIVFQLQRDRTLLWWNFLSWDNMCVFFYNYQTASVNSDPTSHFTSLLDIHLIHLHSSVVIGGFVIYYYKMKKVNCRCLFSFISVRIYWGNDYHKAINIIWLQRSLEIYSWLLEVLLKIRNFLKTILPTFNTICTGSD